MKEPTQRRSALSTLLFWIALVLLLGVACSYRITDVTERTFWGDEAWRSQQILHAQSYSSLLQGKYYGMEMPVQLGEYILGKVGLTLFGINEWGFRIWSILASLLALVVLTSLSLQYVSRTSTLSLIGLMAVSAGYIEHSLEFKPYALEALLFISLAFCFTSTKLPFETRGFLLGLIYCVSCVFGSVWLFTFFVPLYLLYSFFTYSKKIQISLLLFGTIGAYGIYRFFNYKQLVTEKGVTRFWSPYAIDTFDKLTYSLTHTAPYTLDWYLLAPLKATGVSIEFLSIVTASLFFIGIVSLRTRSLNLFLTLPLLVMAVLSILGEYPFFMRVSAFFYPLFFLGSLIGLESLVSLIGFALPEKLKLKAVSIGEPLGAVIIALCIFILPNKAEEGFQKRNQNITPMLREIDARNPEDVVFANYQASLALAFYRPKLMFPRQVRDLHTPKGADHQLACHQIEKFTSAEDSSRTYLLAIDRTGTHGDLLECCKEAPTCTVQSDLAQPKAYLLVVS